MTLRTMVSFALALTCTIGFCSRGDAGGDPFYYSTWYAQPSTSLAWSSQSVMRTDSANVSLYSLGSISTTSPRYFVPGYGYVVQRSFATTRWSAYEPTWSYGMIQPSSVSTGLFGTTATTGPGVVPGTLHLPWYLPGSPGNARSPLSGL